MKKYICLLLREKCYLKNSGILNHFEKYIKLEHPSFCLQLQHFYMGMHCYPHLEITVE